MHAAVAAEAPNPGLIFEILQAHQRSAALRTAIESQGGGLTWTEVPPRLDDVFIHLLSVKEKQG